MVTVTQRRGSVRSEVKFEFRAPAYAQRVTLAGDFNQWNQESRPMQKTPFEVWEVTTHLAPGRYEYKFLVNGGEWFPDPKAKLSAPNRYGTANSIIEVK